MASCLGMWVPCACRQQSAALYEHQSAMWLRGATLGACVELWRGPWLSLGGCFAVIKLLARPMAQHCRLRCSPQCISMTITSQRDQHDTAAVLQCKYNSDDMTSSLPNGLQCMSTCSRMIC